jgi:hypothetical protein
MTWLNDCFLAKIRYLAAKIIFGKYFFSEYI